MNGQTTATASKPKRPAKPKAKPEEVELGVTDRHRVAAMMFALAGTPVRVAILEALKGPDGRIVGEMAHAVQASQPAISHHLALLRNARVVECIRQGKTNRYRLTAKGQALLSLVEGLTQD